MPESAGPPASTALEMLARFTRGESAYHDLERGVDGPWGVGAHSDASTVTQHSTPESELLREIPVVGAALDNVAVVHPSGMPPPELRRPRAYWGRTMLSSLLYFVGSVLYLSASITILPFLDIDAYPGDVMFLVGSMAFVLAAIVDVYDARESLRRDPVPPPGPLPCHRFPKKVETLIQCYLFLLGANLFLIGSVLYMPQTGLKGMYGTFVFRAGSCTYITAALYGLMMVFFPHVPTPVPINPLAVSVSVQYMCGSTLFITGGQFFVETDFTIGAWIWVVGSILFTSGSITGLYVTWTGLVKTEGQPPPPPLNLNLKPANDSPARVSPRARPRLATMLMQSSYAHHL